MNTAVNRKIKRTLYHVTCRVVQPLFVEPTHPLGRPTTSLSAAKVSTKSISRPLDEKLQHAARKPIFIYVRQDIYL